MNRLILIGNGFDLAHGLKTRYDDFLVGYLKKAFNIAAKDGKYSDELISVIRVGDPGLCNDRWCFNGVEEMVEYFFKQISIFALSKDVIELQGRDTTFYYTNPFRFNVSSDFFKDLLTKCRNRNWVDIENEYYDSLRSILNTKNAEDKNKELALLNKSLECIISNLHHYLSEIECSEINEDVFDFFNTHILAKELGDYIDFPPQMPKNTHVLNFNYTATVEKYIARLDENFSCEVNFIHGKINDANNNLVFGFGDELDPTYEMIENERVKGFFKFIKSFWYFRTKNYHNLIRFIDSEPFQIFIWGHSCGLSDRTMLNMIFEHINCKSIKIFYHQVGERNNFNEVTEEISRHFRDKKSMRKKIVNYEYCEPLPQTILKM